MVLTHRRLLPSTEQAIHDRLDSKPTASLTNKLRDAFTRVAQHSEIGGYNHQGPGRVGGGTRGRSGPGDSHKSKCGYCNIESHTTDPCQKRKRAQAEQHNDEHICFERRLAGCIKVDWVSYKRIKPWWRVKKATAALTTTRECISLWLSAYALAATSDIPKCVIDSGASHHTCNERRSLSTFKMLSLPIIIKLRDNNWITATHFGFVDIIPGYEVNALHAPTFCRTLLSITQLDLCGHMTIFRNGKCSITSLSSCTLARKLTNGI